MDNVKYSTITSFKIFWTVDKLMLNQTISLYERQATQYCLLLLCTPKLYYQAQTVYAALNWIICMSMQLTHNIP